MAKVTAAQKSILEAMANGETIFTDYRGMHLLGNKTVSITTLNSLLDARLIQYEKMVRGVQPYSITEAGRSIVTPIAEPIVETTPIVEVVEAAPVASAAVETKAVKITDAQKNVLEVMANGKIIFTDYLGKFKLDNKTVNAKTLYALLDARLIQYEPMVRSMEKFSITELGRSIVETEPIN